MPNVPRDADAEFAAGPRLPAARRWNLDVIAETDPAKNPFKLTHMLPSPDRFAQACCKSQCDEAG
jgi:thiosulfate/3-mercaptopyruvate sulfurtransferase